MNAARGPHGPRSPHGPRGPVGQGGQGGPAGPRGFTLVELALACTIAAILVAVAVPSYRGHLVRSARLDAVDALTRVQMTQEQYRSHHGLYAGELSALRGVAPTSPQGRYALSLQLTGPEAYRATARAVGTQTQDKACPALTLDVQQGFAQAGPAAQCWNR